MKKVLALLLVLILLGGVIYWIGLPNLKVDADQVGVIYTKTHGYELITAENRNRWDARKLLPNNYHLLLFSKNYVSFPISINTQLPEADLLLQALDLNQDISPKVFTFSLDGEISFRIRPEYILNLLESNIITSTTLDQFYTEQADLINAFLSQKFATLNLNFISYTNSNELQNILQAEFPALHFNNIKITSFSLPSQELYTLATENIESQQRLALEQEYELKTQEHQLNLKHQEEILTLKLKLAKLEEIGQLLTRYPILIAYLALEQGHSPNSPLVQPFLSSTLTAPNEIPPTNNIERE